MKSVETKLAEVSEWLGEGSLNFFGKPFAGKDTQADKLAGHLGVSVLGGGDILRNSVLPPKVRASMERGELIPTADYQKIVMPYLSQEAFAGKPLLLSSVGRVSGEELGVLAATEASGHPIKAAPYLDITVDVAFRRLADMPDRGRADDNPESLKVRYEEFFAKTEPVLQTYDSLDMLVTVDAMDEIDIVFRNMIHLLHERATA